MSVRPERYNFSVWKGTTFRKQLVFHEGDEDSPPRDLTGYTASMPIREQRLGGTLLATLNTENGGIVLGGEDGTIDLYMSDEQTQAATWELGSYSLLLTFSGDTDSLIYGNFSIKRL